MRSVELTVPNFLRKSFSVSFFPVCWIILSAVFCGNIFYVLMGFIKNLSLNSIWLILACELKLNCRDLHVRRVSYDGHKAIK